MRFGILGDAKIAREKLLPAIRAAGHEVVQVGRRDPGAGIDPIWGDATATDYDGLLGAGDVDAVYIPLPNHLHVEFAIKALEAGKPVLCEKPIALTLDEMDRLEDAANRTGLYVYDGYMVRHHPQWKWLAGIDVGMRMQVNAHFSYPPQPKGNIRNYAKWGGGPIWDIGCYCVLSGMLLFEGTPRLVGVCKRPEDNLDVEMSASAVIDFGRGQMLNLSVSSGSALCQSVQLVGDRGWARLDVPFNPPAKTTGSWASARDGAGGLLGRGESIAFDACDQYALMVQDFAKAVAEGRRADLAQSRDLTMILGAMVAAR